MTDATQGFLLLNIVVVIVAVISHLYFREYWLANIVSCFSSGLLFNILISIINRVIDKYFLIAAGVTTVYAFLISIIIGFFIFLWRKLAKM